MELTKEKIEYYSRLEPKVSERTTQRLITMKNLGMTECGEAQFGVEGVMSGLYIEKVWSYSDKDFKGYLNWVKECINKHKFLLIAHKLKTHKIEYTEARTEICNLLGLTYKPRYTGRAIVKSRGQKWKYEGHELEIIGLYMVHKNGLGVFPDGTREFKLSLVGTEFEEVNTDHTVIPETDLEILELIED